VVPLYVALSRLYRGMHHPSDVTASFLNAAACITIMALAILNPKVRWRRSEIAAERSEIAAERSEVAA
jgi:membrane-associated phospholipid phosphatase